MKLVQQQNHAAGGCASTREDMFVETNLREDSSRVPVDPVTEKP